MNSPKPDLLPPDEPTFRRPASTQRSAPWIVLGIVSACFVCLIGVVALVNDSGAAASRAKPVDERPLTLPEPSRRPKQMPRREPPLPKPVQPAKEIQRPKPKRVTSYFDLAKAEAEATPFVDFPTNPVVQHDPDLPPALKRVVDGINTPAVLGGDPKATPIADEVIDQMIAQLKTDPSVANRVNAATSLGRRSDVPDKIVPVLLEAARRDPSTLVRLECVKAFGELDNLGKSEATILGFLRDIVFDAKSEENKRVAADALVNVAPESSEAKQVLRAALVGSRGASPISASELRGPGIFGDVFDWRHWAYDQLRESPADPAWAVPFLIKISEREIAATGGVGYQTHEHLEATATTMVHISGGSPAVQAHLKKCVNVVFPEMDGAEQLTVFYDSLLKRIEAEKVGTP